MVKKKQSRPQRKSRKRPSTRVALQRSAERRALQLALISDRLRQRALRGEEIDLRQLVAVEQCAADAAAKLVEPAALKQPARPADDRIEIVLVKPDGSVQPLPDSSSGNASPAFSSGSFAPRSGTDYFSAPTPDELRRLEQQGMLETELDALRKAQAEMQRGEKRGVLNIGGKNSWLKN
jgi:hypothetical protein